MGRAEVVSHPETLQASSEVKIRELSASYEAVELDFVIEVEPAHKIQNFRTKNEKCKLPNSTTIASGYASRDPQGGTRMEAF